VSQTSPSGTIMSCMPIWGWFTSRRNSFIKHSLHDWNWPYHGGYLSKI
jgi:hypothetical protein